MPAEKNRNDRYALRFSRILHTPLSALPSVFCLLCGSVVLCPPLLPAQPDTTSATIITEPLASSPFDLLLPSFLRTAYATRRWVRDSLTAAGTQARDDLDRVDMIYLHALSETCGDHGPALLAAAVSTFEHRTIPLRIGIDFPLTLESEENFSHRVAALPSILFTDRPNGDDRDKLQHFFASAWLTWALDNSETADLIGLAIETGEGWLIRGQESDRRDVRANRLGQIFMELLHRNPHALPSMVFRAWNREYARRAGR